MKTAYWMYWEKYYILKQKVESRHCSQEDYVMLRKMFALATGREKEVEND